MTLAETPIRAVRVGEALWLLTLRGEHDLATSEAIARALADVPRGASVVVDLAAVSFLDGSFLHALSASPGYPEHIVLVAPAGSRVRWLLGLIGAGCLLRFAASRRHALVRARSPSHWATPLEWDVGMARPVLAADTAAAPLRRPAAGHRCTRGDRQAGAPNGDNEHALAWRPFGG